MDAVTQAISDLISRGGWVMWPLAVVSVIGLTLILERAWFWLRVDGPGRAARLDELGRHLRAGRLDDAAAMARADRSIYGRLVGRLLEERPSTEAASAAAQSQLPAMERYMPTLGTIITAAPMLGILGTVTGIIRVANVFRSDTAVTDPAAILPGIGEALLTTVVGLIIALVVLLPFNAFKARIDRAVGRMEVLVASLMAGTHADKPAPRRND